MKSCHAENAWQLFFGVTFVVHQKGVILKCYKFVDCYKSCPYDFDMIMQKAMLSVDLSR